MYVVLLPAIGITVEVMATFARKKIFGYKMVLYTAVATGVLSFFVWAHHQFIAGIDPRMANVFTITTLLISVPIAEMCFVYIATLYKSSITLNTPMLWALSFIGEFLIGGVTEGRRRMLAEAENRARSKSEAGFSETQTPFRAAQSSADEADEGAPRRGRYCRAESPLILLARRKDRDGQPFLDDDLVRRGGRK